MTLRTLLIDLNDRHDEAFRAIEDALDDRDIHYSMCFSDYIPSPESVIIRVSREMYDEIMGSDG